MKTLYRIISIIVMTVVAFGQNANAQALDGTYTVTQGNNVTVQIGAACQTTLVRATSISTSWTTSNSAISIVSKTNTTCTVKGNSPIEKARLNYQCSYRYDGYYRTMNLYYEITVKSNVVLITRLEVSPETATINVDTTQASIATVSSNGLVTAHSEGKVRIWENSTDGSTWADYCDITVNALTKVSVIELSDNEKTMSVGDEFTLSAIVTPDEAINKKVSWETSNVDVASVSNGVVTALAFGECDIICTALDGSGESASCHITVEAPEVEHYWLSVVLPNGSFNLDVTELNEISLCITPEDGYSVHSIQINGNGQPIEAGGTSISLPKLEENTVVNAVFVSDGITTSIDILENHSTIKISVNQNVVSVTGLASNEIGSIYNTNGVLITTIQNEDITLNHKGIYILHVSNKSYKFAI